MAIRLKRLVALIESFGKDWSTKALQYLRDNGPVELDSSALRYVSERVRDSLVRGASGDAIRWAGIVLLITRGGGVFRPRFSDAFRPSHHENDVQRLAVLSAAIGGVAAALPAEPEFENCRKKMRSIHSFVELYRTCRVDENSLIDALHANPAKGIYLLLARVEMAFGGLTAPEGIPYPGSFSEMSREDIATGVSYGLEAYAKAHGVPRLSPGSFTISEADVQSIDNAILAGNWLAELIDAEADVFRHGYEVAKMGPSDFEIRPGSDRLGMARALGYLRRVSQAASDKDHAPGEAWSFNTMAEQFAARLGDSLFTIRAGRLLLHVSTEAMAEMSKHLFLPAGLYKEEGVAIRGAARELLASPDAILRFEIVPGLSVLDAIRIQRVFRLFGVARFLRLGRNDVAESVRRASLVASVTHKELAALLESAGFGSASVSAFLELASWDVTSREHLDIQYTPLIRVGDTYMLALLVCGFSNVLRNMLMISEARLHADEADDPLGRIMRAALVDGGARVRLGKKYTHAGADGEVDVLAYVDGRMLALECKETLEPCSSFEMRTTWDDLEKAAGQLDGFATAWGDSAFRSQIVGELGWGDERAQLTTGIVISHRVLAGVRFRGHPVRPIWEFASFCRNGTARVQVRSTSIEQRIRPSGSLRAAHLDDYLAEEGSLYRALWAAHAIEVAEAPLKGASLKMPRYGFNPLKHLALSGVLPPAVSTELIHKAEELRQMEDAARKKGDRREVRSVGARYLCLQRMAERHIKAMGGARESAP